jgi:hypothetical protein
VELDRQTVGAQTMDHGVLPVLIGFPGVFVAALIGVTVLRRNRRARNMNSPPPVT